MSAPARRVADSEAVTSPLAVAPVAAASGSRRRSGLGDYAQLFKARVTSLVVMTAWTGYYMGAQKSGVSSLSWDLLSALAGIGMTAAGAAALNEVLERRVDALMMRTRNRPLPANRMKPSVGLAAGVLGLIAGPACLAISGSALAAMLAWLTAAAYLGLYTPLKRVSPAATFVGAFPGAMPPLLGWVAARGKMEIEALALFLIVFAWQFPHFQAIAWLYRDDYAAVGIKMLPVVDREGHMVARQMLAYGVALVPVSLLPFLLRMAGAAYLGGALAFGIIFLWFNFRLALAKLPVTNPASRTFARRLLQASVVYLPLLFALMMIDRMRP